jgi:hypothetical protein
MRGFAFNVTKLELLNPCYAFHASLLLIHRTYHERQKMSTKSLFQTTEVKKLTTPQIKALVSYCLMVNAGCSDLTVGEIHEFVVTNGKRPVTIQRTERQLKAFVEEGMALKRMELQTGGKRMTYRYYPNDQTFRAAALYASFLPTKLGEFCDNLMHGVNAGVSEAHSYIRKANRLNCNGANGPENFAEQNQLWNGGE